MLVDGRPGTVNPFIQSLVVVAADVVEFGDQIKALSLN
jgi:hypothetical protein